jgi:hypothetical protein
MIEVVRYEAWHLRELVAQPAQTALKGTVSPEQAAAVEGPLSFTALADGRPVCCAGIVEYWPGRGEAWAFLAADCRKELRAITNAMRRFLEVCPVRRVEAAVDVDFEPGHRWCRLLGFKLEASLLKAYLPEGGDVSLYAKVS